MVWDVAGVSVRVWVLEGVYGEERYVKGVGGWEGCVGGRRVGGSVSVWDGVCVWGAREFVGIRVWKVGVGGFGRCKSVLVLGVRCEVCGIGGSGMKCVGLEIHLSKEHAIPRHANHMRTRSRSTHVLYTHTHTHISILQNVSSADVLDVLTCCSDVLVC